MTADREVLRTRLIDAMARERWENYAYASCRWEELSEEHRQSIRDDEAPILDAVLGLCSPCQTCGGTGEVQLPQWPVSRPCPDCPSVPVLVEYLMEQVGVRWVSDDGPVGSSIYPDDSHRPTTLGTYQPVWVYKENRDR